MLDHSESAVSYQGGTNARSFPVPFPFLESGHLAVERTAADGAVARLTEGADYLVTRHTDGTGQIQIARAVPADETLVIRRDMPFTQEILFHNQGPNSPAAIEEGLDKLTMIAQQLRATAGNQEARLAGLAEETASARATAAAAAAAIGKLDPRTSHAERHHASGPDPLTPAAIGALAADHATAADAHPQYAPRSALDTLFPAGPEAYYIDPAGDVLASTPGTKAAPFRSIATALRLLAARRSFSGFDVYLYVNPGDYPAEDLNLTLPILTSANLAIHAADPAAKPVIRAAGLHCHGNQAVYLNNLELRLIGNVGAHRGAHLHASGVDVRLEAANQLAVYAESGACVFLSGAWALDGGGLPQWSLFFAEKHALIFLLPGSKATVANIPSLYRAAVADDFSTINTGAELTFPEGIPGRRYEVYCRSYIRTNGAGEYYFPGDTAGYVQTEAYASYY